MFPSVKQSKMAATKGFPLILVLSSLIIGLSQGQSTIPVVPGLSYTFYSSSCPGLDFIIRGHLWQIFQSDLTQAAGLLRLHFHDCFVQVYISISLFSFVN